MTDADYSTVSTSQFGQKGSQSDLVDRGLEKVWQCRKESSASKGLYRRGDMASEFWAQIVKNLNSVAPLNSPVRAMLMAPGSSALDEGDQGSVKMTEGGGVIYIPRRAGGQTAG